VRGYTGIILRINLSNCNIVREHLPNFLTLNYIGGKGFGTFINYNENPSDLDPYSSDNNIILVTGPGGGTSLPTATRIGLFAKSPLNNVGIDSYLGGSFGHSMKKAGYDIIIIKGKAKNPVYITIVNEIVSIEDASFLWGKDIYETEDILKDKIGKNTKVLSIGPAGENLISYAGIGHEHNRHFGRMGSGALMGSKNLKAVALIGTGNVDVWDYDGLKKYVRDLNKRIKEDPSTGKIYPAEGTTNFVSKANKLGVFPSHYWHKGEAKYKDRINFEYMSKNTLVKQSRCFGCPIGCAHINKIKEGPYAGIEIEGPEFETIYAFGGLCDVKSIEEIIKLNDVCDRMGIDTMTAGNVMGLLMDASERKRIPENYYIGFGDTERMIVFLNNIVQKRKGWEIFGEGVKKIAEYYDLEDLAIHVKGLEPSGYDPRGVKSMAITYGVGNRGATHLSSNSYARDIAGKARDFEVKDENKNMDRFSMNKKAELVYNMINFNAIADCFIFCRFLNRDLLTWDDYSNVLYLLTGIEKDKKEFEKIANDIVTLGRWYNIKGGLTSKNDLLPERFFNEPNISVRSNGEIISKDEYIKEIKNYYSIRKWNNNGIPNYMPKLVE